LKNKSDVFSKFKEFKALVQNLSEREIKTLRSDNGGEFTSNEFKTFSKEVGIKRELSTPSNPQQNGVVERKNKTNNIINLTGTFPSSHFFKGHIFYLVFKNGATGSTPSLFRWYFQWCF
jgi:transposase InsO family protein